MVHTRADLFSPEVWGGHHYGTHDLLRALAESGDEPLPEAVLTLATKRRAEYDAYIAREARDADVVRQIADIAAAIVRGVRLDKTGFKRPGYLGGIWHRSRPAEPNRCEDGGCEGIPSYWLPEKYLSDYSRNRYGAQVPTDMQFITRRVTQDDPAEPPVTSYPVCHVHLLERASMEAIDLWTTESPRARSYISFTEVKRATKLALKED